MTKDYKPELARGEILVEFNLPDYITLFSPEKFAESLGYKYVSGWSVNEDIAVFKVPKGGEKEAIKKIESCKDLVKWAEQRDLTLERRTLAFENMTEKILNLDYDSLSKKDYNKKIDGLISDLENMKEK